mmetsp:Transcript_7056/g.14322  ORF Transcript_7056/g.14322 Transcript_7056/m.14322 type:complete len:292 (+) Transcript_7056:225-1100(+)|eukprot:CAMPEP_0118636908 /NCGR_PEP_ID=MMETSP0785-20121206/2877_1 /TAXON_ID=91992 /ORGANISM="Bolidomonas pacifica, Strain CCMP 1866" /LENGTH=291 /DNA_ID=CAMNT_0006528073 /DNA_START=174 /DNA_END=1049 /DNA_ORIENTATION=+
MSGLRRGKWSAEEEQYVSAIIFRFNQGTLPVPAGTTLRSYLSDKLNCDPMRITKKFTGEEAIGKRVFKPERLGMRSQQELREISDSLLELEIRFKKKLASLQRESERKAQRAVVLPPNIPPHLASSSRSAVDMAKTANWLNRANEMLLDPQIVHQQDDYSSLAETKGLLNEGATLKRSRNEAPPSDGTNACRRRLSTDTSTSNDAMALFGFMQSINKRLMVDASTNTTDNSPPQAHPHNPIASTSDEEVLATNTLCPSSATTSATTSYTTSANSSSNSLEKSVSADPPDER